MSMRGKLPTWKAWTGRASPLTRKFVADLVATRAPHVIQTREPGGTDLAERLREAILTSPMTPEVETLLLFAARADHVARVIRPRSRPGRGWSATALPTRPPRTREREGRARRPDRAPRGRGASRPRPDRTLVFDCSFEVSRRRLQGKTLDRFEREGRGFFERVRAGVPRARARRPQRMRVIDAAAPVPEIRKALERALSDL